MAETIRYNVGQRGRTHRGQDRNFDLRRLGALVNSAETQERVRNRDMVGYYGHWVRAKFGLIPPENAAVQGKIVNLEPAIVTTHLSADDQGNIEHTTEFLDTAAGKIAERLHKSRTGGFSSAIDARPMGNMHVPTLFAGFDYVLEPNYTTNRGYVFDGIGDFDDSVIFDFVMQDFNRGNAAMTALYDSLQGDHMLALQTMQKLAEENEELLSMIASGKAGAVFDSATPGVRPLLLDRSGADKLAATAAGFKRATLTPLDKLPDEKGERSGASEMLLDRVHQHYRVPR